jgi:hypothetical protein
MPIVVGIAYPTSGLLPKGRKKAPLPRTNNAEDFSQVMPEADPPGRRIQIIN